MLATELTATLVAPPQGVPHPAEIRTLRDRLRAAVEAATGGATHAPELEVTLPVLRRAAEPGAFEAAAEPFTWKPAFVRRSLGLAAVEACVRGRFRGPAEAAAPIAERAVVEWERSGWRTFHWEPWFAALAHGARAVVLAEAATWSSSLWATFDWSVFDRPPRFGGPDDRWRCPTTPAVVLRGRSELRVEATPGPCRAAPERGRPVALVSIAGGCPRAGWEAELAFLALASVVRAPDRAVPARVLGVWPDTGEQRFVEVDGRSLGSAADRVVATVAALVAAQGREGRRSSVTDRHRTSIADGAARQNRARAAFTSGLPAAVSGTASTTSSERGTL